MRKFTSAVFMLAVLLAQSPRAHAYEGRLVPGIWQQSWNDVLKAGIAASPLLKHTEPQIEKLCPGYNASLEKKKIFWQQLMVSLAYKESLHGPGNWISFNGGKNIGLYQVDPRLRTAYGCPGYDLFNAQANIKCGIKMAVRLVGKYKSFLVGSKGGMAAYWQPLRDSTAENRRNRQFILSGVSQACKTNTIAYISTSLHLAADMLDFAPSTTPNTIEDLGLDPSELDNDDSDLVAPNANFSELIPDLDFHPDADDGTGETGT